MAGVDGVLIIMSVSALLTYLFGKRKFDAVEAAIAALGYRDLDPDADVGLSSSAFRELQPPQIRCTPWKAGVARRR